MGRGHNQTTENRPAVVEVCGREPDSGAVLSGINIQTHTIPLPILLSSTGAAALSGGQLQLDKPNNLIWPTRADGQMQVVAGSKNHACGKGETQL
jgi:hypothetical protein